MHPRSHLATIFALAALLIAPVAIAQSDAGPAPSASSSAPPQRQSAPPPGYGYPPPPGYGYYPPPYYVVPVYEPRPAPRWQPGEPAPDGYHVETKSDTKTIKSGVSMLVGFYLISVIAGAALNENEKNKDNTADRKSWSTMYIPVVGPFLSMRNTSTDDAGWALLLVDGLLQSAGVIMTGVGIANRKEYLERNTEESSALKLHVAPMLGRHTTGVAVSASF